MPPAARWDLVEWYPPRLLEPMVAKVLASEVPLESLLVPDEEVVVTDDRPFNEYYVLRRIREGTLDQDSEGERMQRRLRQLEQRPGLLPREARPAR
jgi:hypothetical protein